MIQSMTGYGKACCTLEGGTLTIEIRTLNGKGMDLNLRTSIIPKDKELPLRKKITSALVRGTVDVYLNWQSSQSSESSRLNLEVLDAYYQSVSSFNSKQGISCDNAAILAAILGLPDVCSNTQKELITDENWGLVDATFDECLKQVEDYRVNEGKVLYADVTSRVHKILDIYDKVESFEGERIEATKQRILDAAQELSIKLDAQRFEQEMIFYLEKLDINEEKVRLRQHCRYFLETIDAEPNPGKKLGFIIQEMGREINTTGSKASHAGIQKCVVEMKDELEKIREQSMNIL